MSNFRNQAKETQPTVKWQSSPHTQTNATTSVSSTKHSVSKRAGFTMDSKETEMCYCVRDTDENVRGLSKTRNLKLRNSHKNTIQNMVSLQR